MAGPLAGSGSVFRPLPHDSGLQSGLQRGLRRSLHCLTNTARSSARPSQPGFCSALRWKGMWRPVVPHGLSISSTGPVTKKALDRNGRIRRLRQPTLTLKAPRRLRANTYWLVPCPRPTCATYHVTEVLYQCPVFATDLLAAVWVVSCRTRTRCTGL